jgi:hypothetical protein
VTLLRSLLTAAREDLDAAIARDPATSSRIEMALASPGLLHARDKKEEASCGNHGTTIEFLDTPREAAAQAKKEQKLVLVLHVSGNFEDPRFT